MKYLIVESTNDNKHHEFPCNRTTYAVIGEKLYVDNRGCQFRFPLDHYKFEIIERKQHHEV